MSTLRKAVGVYPNQSAGKFFPVKGGKVEGSFKYSGKEYSFSFPIIKDVYIHDVYEGKGGKIAHSLKGIGYEAAVSSIWLDAKGPAAEDRVVTVIVLKAITKAILAEESYVTTLFGRKYIKRNSNGSSEATIDLPEDALALLEEEL